ncbi:MAG: hypothetical protein EPO26_03940 [Chloroflexota bacterium]|nr:MAG: hypothetical protein EPO26_03940 [Chloroflexota bacterium]
MPTPDGTRPYAWHDLEAARHRDLVDEVASQTEDAKNLIPVGLHHEGAILGLHRRVGDGVDFERHVGEALSQRGHDIATQRRGLLSPMNTFGRVCHDLIPIRANAEATEVIPRPASVPLPSCPRPVARLATSRTLKPLHARRSGGRQTI